MSALRAAPAPGDTVRVPVRVSRSEQMTSAVVKAVGSHALLVAINGRFH